MRVAILTASLAALAVVGAGAWAASAAPLPLECSALNTQRHATVYAGAYERYCGPGLAVAHVGGKSFSIEGGNCSGRMNRRSFGLIGVGGLRGKGLWFRLAPVVTHSGRERWFVRPGRVDIIDGGVQLPGFSSLPNQGTAIISKDLKSATFSVGSPPRVTGSWTCR